MEDLVKIEDFEQAELLTTAEIAEKEDVSERTIHDRTKEMGILATGYKKNAQGSDSPLFAYRSWKKSFRLLRLQAEFSDLSQETKKRQALLA